MFNHWALRVVVLATLLAGSNVFAADKPHAVFVVGTPHYNPAATMPHLAKQLEQFGFRTTIVKTDYNPEKNAKGIPGLEVLKDADVAIFFLRFLTLPEDQMKHITDYVEAGKPVVGFRTSSHAFMYPKTHKLAKWNNGFGKDVLGSKYFIHLSSTTQVSAAKGAEKHEVLSGVDVSKPRLAGGTLYLADLPKDATVLLRGTGQGKKTGTVTNGFGTHELKKTMTDDVVWVWKNQWGGRVFSSSIGHVDSFKDEHWIRLFVNGIHWAAGKPVPANASVKGLTGNISKHASSGAKKKSKPKAQPKPAAKAPAATQLIAAKKPKPKKKPSPDAKNRTTGKKEPAKDPALAKYGIYQKTAGRAAETAPVVTTMPLKLNKGDRIAYIGNTLLDMAQDYGYFEAMLHQRYPKHQLAVRNLAWPADTPDLRPRPSNFADTEQHLTFEKIDVIFAAYGYSESFKGDEGIAEFRKSLTDHVARLKTRAFNGRTGPRIVLISPVANENIKGVAASDLNNARIKKYVDVVKQVAAEQKVGFADVFTTTLKEMSDPKTDLTFNGAHLLKRGYETFARSLHKEVFGENASVVNEDIRETIVDKNNQYFRRFRPVNTFYYVGGRNGRYGYLDFLPAMRNFEIMVKNREERIWQIAQGMNVAAKVDDSNLPPLPETAQSRGANRWITAKEELKEFKVDPRFEVNLFAGEEEFPDIAAPIQMRWDSKGRLWVSCSTTYPHVYPGNEPNDKIVILEDTDGDGKADKSTVFADDLHIPLSFEFGDGGVYVSEEPHLSFIKDTDGDGKADFRRKVLSGFGCEDSHHALHDIAWSPDGDLVFRESIFHHTQVETPYGPVRQANSGWFRYQPRNHKLTSFGTYHSTNPWGVTYDDWGQHVASHPIFASAFHAIDPPYPTQHPKPGGLRAYSGTCGQEFIDFGTFPKELQGGFIKVRYKPTNRVEIHKWNEYEYGYDEEYVGDVIFSSNLSFIPVDIRFGPRGALYVCDWYNPVKGHAQYSLRDDRRDRHSGRIWRITTKGKKLQDPPKIADASIEQLLEIHKRPEYRYRYWAKRELRAMDSAKVKAGIDKWVKSLSKNDPRFRHHQVEGIWLYRNIGAVNADLLRDVITCEEHHARAAATRQLRYWHSEMSDAIELLRRSANDPNGLVRLEAANAASYIGTKDALDAMLDVANHPKDKHLAYAFTCALGSKTLRRHWDGNPAYAHVPSLLKTSGAKNELAEPSPSASQAQFDVQKNLKRVVISCVSEQMKYTVRKFTAKPGQPVKLVFTNPDATDHNLVIVKPGALEEVGIAGNEMAKDPRNATSDFVPKSKKHLILHHTPMIGPTRKAKVAVLRFNAPTKPGVYPYVCTFPGHWVIMTGRMVVANSDADAESLLAAQGGPKFVKNWTMKDLAKDAENLKGRNVLAGLKAFRTARCDQCHKVGPIGVALGPDLSKVSEKYKGVKLLQQVLEPSTEINEQYQTWNFQMKKGTPVSGVVSKEDRNNYHVIQNLLNPKAVTKVAKRHVKKKTASKLSSMPQGLAVVLTKDEILDMLAWLEAGGVVK